MRLIDADALLERFNRKADICTALMDKDTAGDFAFYCKLADAIEEMPTIEAEPVKRCKDCKYYNTHGCDKGFGWCERNGAGCAKADEWFCEAWEKKGE